MNDKTYDVAIIGAGVVGCALAGELARRFGSMLLLDKEASVGFHTSGRNSGVVHSGFNPKPGKLKARLCVEGSRLIRQCGTERGIPCEQVGTFVRRLAARPFDDLSRAAPRSAFSQRTPDQNCRRLRPDRPQCSAGVWPCSTLGGTRCSGSTWRRWRAARVSGTRFCETMSWSVWCGRSGRVSACQDARELGAS